MPGIFLLVTLALAVQAPGARPVEMLRTGSFHGDEVPSNAPGRWSALVLDGGGASLRPVRVSVVREYDAIVDENGEQTGKRVQISPHVEATVLLRGLRSLKPGLVATAIGEQNFRQGRRIEARLGTRSYHLSFECIPHEVAEGQSGTCELKVESGPSTQVLFTYQLPFISDGEWHTSGILDTPMILWAGDLDGDGRLDVLVNTSDNDNVGEVRLYLSSLADPARLMAEAARFTYVGC